MICAVGAVLRNISAIPDGVSKIFSSDELIKLIVALFQHADLMARTQAQRVIFSFLTKLKKNMSAKTKTKK